MSRRYGKTSHDRQRAATAQHETPRGNFTRLAAKGRIVAQLSSGDVRVIAEEVAEELEALAGPVAAVIPIGRR